MIRFFLSCIAFSFLTACLSWPEVPGHTTVTAASAPLVAPAGQYHFGWKLSGNRAVAPLQVFDDGHHTWLQFPPGQATPAIFARLPQGDQLLSPQMGAGGLLMLDGVWSPLVLRGGSLQSVALRLNTPTAQTAPNIVPGADRTPARPQDGTVTAAANAISLPVAAIPPATPATPATPVAQTGTAMTTMPPDTTTQQYPQQTSPTPAFAVSPTDGTLRAALARWAKIAGWTFSLEHWAVDADIPIVAAATFPLPFEEAVQALMSSTELSEQPLTPCFYANKVLRIILHTQACDRSVVSTG